MSSISAQPTAHNIDHDLMNEIVQLMDNDTYTTLMELSGTEGFVRPYGSMGINKYAGPRDSSNADYSERGYRSESFNNYNGFIDSSHIGHSAGESDSYRSGTEYSESGYSLNNLQNYTGLIDSSTTSCSTDTSSLLPQASINSGYMYDNHSINYYGYSNQEYYSDINSTYESNYIDISNNVPEQDDLSIYSSNTDSYTGQGMYDRPINMNTCDNDQTWDILDDVEYKHVIPYQDIGYLSSGMDQLQLDSSYDDVKPVKGKTRTKKQPKDVNVSTNAINIINKMISGSGKRARSTKNWEFLMRLLANPETNPSVICWEDRENYVFRLVEPEKIMELWNERTHKCSQTYDNFARGLRYHYQKGVLQPVPEKQLVYRCGPVAIQYFDNIECS